MLIYLSGERKSFLHPLVMGLSSALTHSLSLILIASIVHVTQHLVTGNHHPSDERIVDWMRWVSASLVLIVGLWMTWYAWKSTPPKCSCRHHKHEIKKGKIKQAKGQMNSISEKSSYSMSAILGAAFGLMPCPSAMAAYFSGLSSGSPATSYFVIGLFAAGVATSLTLVGMIVQVFGNRFTNTEPLLMRLPWHYLRAGLITTIGMFYLVNVALT